MRILVSNDDGISRAGLHALVQAVEPLGEVWVVAPDQEMSGVSHAITLGKPLRVTGFEGRARWFAVSGTPTDCVYLALHHFMKDAPPDVVISGINHGSNLGTDAHYSGTVSAAHEGMVNGIPSVAFSLVGSKPFDFTKAAQFAGRLDSLGRRSRSAARCDAQLQRAAGNRWPVRAVPYGDAPLPR